MSALTDLQASVGKIVADIGPAVADKAALQTKVDALTAQNADLNKQLAEFAGDAKAMADMKAQLDAADALIAAPAVPPVEDGGTP